MKFHFFHFYLSGNEVEMEPLVITSEEAIASIVERAVTKILQASIQAKEPVGLPELMNVSQAADYLSLAKQTLYTFKCRGNIPYIKRGKKLYFKKSALDCWLVNKTN